MASVRTASWTSTDRHGQLAQPTLQPTTREGAPSANEPTPLVGPPEHIQAQIGNTTSRTVVPNSFGQRPLAQPINPVVSSPQSIQAQSSQLLVPNERFATQYRSDASSRMYSASSLYSSLNLPDKSEIMAATQGPLGPAMPSYQPHAQSPTSMSAPGHPAGRSMYSSAIQPSSHQFYYNTYMSHPQSHYAYSPTFQQSPISAHHQQYTIPSFQQTHHMQQPQTSPQHYSSHFEASQTPKVRIQRSAQLQPGGSANTPKVSQQNQSSPTGNSQSSAPGPIRATTPTVVKQDGNGVTTISFEYSKDRVKRPYEIRCDVEKVDIETLSKEHKEENCVYPRACSSETYKGNRWQYESECNEVAWALAYLNPELKGKRGLIQRAVDSWRNSNKDKKLRSRRVRRLAKTERRAKMHQLQQAQQRYQHDTKQAQAAAYMKSTPPVMQSPVPTSSALNQPEVVTTIGLPQYHHHTVHTDDNSQPGHIPGGGTSYGDTKPSMPSYQSQ